MAILKVQDRTKDRYHALTISTVWDRETVRNARALLVGAGALGNEVAKNLAMMGIAAIAVVDRDTVETANLTRSIFFREADHGQPKVKALASRVREFNPDVTVIPLKGELEDQVGLGLLRRMDLVFSCLDNRLARRTLNRMCEKVAKPWVDGSMEDLFGDVSVFRPRETACYECTLTSTDLLGIEQATSCRGIALQHVKAGRVPTTSTMGSIVSAIQVQEALKLLHGSPHAMAGKRLVINGLLNDFYAVPLHRRPVCMGHFQIDNVTEVPEFTAGSSTPRDLLARFRSDTSATTCYIEVGRELMTELRCGGCGANEVLAKPVSRMAEAEARCPSCSRVRTPETTHVITGSEDFAGLSLQELGFPPLDLIEVRCQENVRWYELTGDLAALPESITQVRPGDVGGETKEVSSVVENG